MNVKKNQNIILHESSISRKDRENINGHKGTIIWFTGLSGSGKSTLAYAFEYILHKNNIQTYVLDGDNIRQGLCKDLGFSAGDRTENIRRIGEVSRLFLDSGKIVLTAFISPFINDRKIVRELVNKDEFIEVFCDSPLDVCELRDPKGLYKKARSGEIPEFTGINSPYESPECPELTLKTNELSVQQCLEKLISYLEDVQILNSIQK